MEEFKVDSKAWVWSA